MRIIKNPEKSDWPKYCIRPAVSSRDLKAVVGDVFGKVAKQGDKALKDYTEQFDKVAISSVAISPAEVTKAAKSIKLDLKEAIDQAYENICRFHEAQQVDSKKEAVETVPGVKCWRESRPVERVGLYVPGGSAPLISTVLMLGVPARIAGCREIILCTPPGKDGKVNAAICYAAAKIGATRLVRVGGIQAIAALAQGTESVPKVDKVFGPGNQYVTAAKEYAAARCGVAIDMPAGPSEVLVIADDRANAAFVAADLLSQAEHGPDSQAMFLTDSFDLAKKVKVELETQLKSLPRKEIAAKSLGNSFCIVFDSIDTAIKFSNQYAPEHLILSVRQAKQYSKAVQNAGSVFLGDYSPESAGDYASGTNHTLPTAGWARSYSGVSLDSFVKKVTFQSLTKQGLNGLAPIITTLAEAEGLQAHARAVSIRIPRSNL